MTWKKYFESPCFDKPRNTNALYSSSFLVSTALDRQLRAKEYRLHFHYCYYCHCLSSWDSHFHYHLENYLKNDRRPKYHLQGVSLSPRSLIMISVALFWQHPLKNKLQHSSIPLFHLLDLDLRLFWLCYRRIVIIERKLCKFWIEFSGDRNQKLQYV